MTGDGRLPQASMLITLIDLKSGFTELDSALKLDLLVRKCEDYRSLDQLKTAGSLSDESACKHVTDALA